VWCSAKFVSIFLPSLWGQSWVKKSTVTTIYELRHHRPGHHRGVREFNMWHCVAVWCSVLHCVAVSDVFSSEPWAHHCPGCSRMQCVGVRCNALRNVAVYYNAMWVVAVCCSVLHWGLLDKGQYARKIPERGINLVRVWKLKSLWKTSNISWTSSLLYRMMIEFITSKTNLVPFVQGLFAQIQLYVFKFWQTRFSRSEQERITGESEGFYCHYWILRQAHICATQLMINMKKKKEVCELAACSECVRGDMPIYVNTMCARQAHIYATQLIYVIPWCVARYICHFPSKCTKMDYES